MIDRTEFAMELKEEQRLRETLRKLLKTYRNEKRLEETKLRRIVRHMIMESGKTDVPDEQPHKNTGINVLEDLLRNIIPTVEDGYKALTSALEQRQSFRAHMLNAIQNSLRPVDVVAGLPHSDKGAAEEAELEEQDLKITVNDDDKFIPVRDADIETEEETEEANFTDLEGLDMTGRNFASNTFNQVEKQILDAYESLAAEEDRELFYDYLLTNFKLYFDKFEDELKATVPEPESPDYSPAADAAVDAEEELAI